jgi:hypothetical protein
MPHYIEPIDCVNKLLHLTSCDRDGYCNHCGHQESGEEIIAVVEGGKPGDLSGKSEKPPIEQRAEEIVNTLNLGYMTASESNPLEGVARFMVFTHTDDNEDGWVDYYASLDGVAEALRDLVRGEWGVGDVYDLERENYADPLPISVKFTIDGIDTGNRDVIDGKPSVPNVGDVVRYADPKSDFERASRFIVTGKVDGCVNIRRLDGDNEDPVGTNRPLVKASPDD